MKRKAHSSTNAEKAVCEPLMTLWGASAKGGVRLQSKGGAKTQGGVSLQRVGTDRKGCGINAKDFRQVG